MNKGACGIGLRRRVFCILGWILFCAYGVVCMTCKCGRLFYMRCCIDRCAVTTTARHTWDVPLSAITPAWLKRNAVLCILYPLSTWCAKMAIFVLYIRLFGRVKWITWSCWFGIVFSTVLYWTAIVLLSFYNFPHKGDHWDLLLGMKIQNDQNTFVVWLVVGSFNLFLDVFLLVLPMPIVMGLRMSLQKRIGLAAVFLTGIV
jgi:hypothetical protein